MGDLAEDTTVTRASDDGTFVADLSRDWEIWGASGGGQCLYRRMQPPPG